MEESLPEYMLRRFRSAYPSVPMTLEKVKHYLKSLDDLRELDDSHLNKLRLFQYQEQGIKKP